MSATDDYIGRTSRHPARLLAAMGRTSVDLVEIPMPRARSGCDP